jgi:AraC-like DNA-binding protein
MVTEEHSEDLAVWAFRTGVRDYLVKPVEVGEIASRLTALPIPRPFERRASRANVLPLPRIPWAARYAAPTLPRGTLPAVRYIEAHLEEKITLAHMAERCGMSPFRFSRAFKGEHTVTFQEYLMRRRVAKAQQLLRNPRATVGDVAYPVGFTDPPYFARVFRRLVGPTPSAFRHNAATGLSSDTLPISGCR